MSLPRREGSRDTREGLIISKYPDVCRSPKCPVPYTIVAYQSDDANTAATVRMTGQRAHKQNSIVTNCSGDEPGVGLGVKSNTVGSICHRKGHSNNVRIEGQWATRHGDAWYMNNRNTEGVLNWYTGHRSFDPTPPLAAQTSATSAPSRSTPGEVMSDAAPEAVFSAPGAELAFLDTTGQFTSPQTQTQTAPQTSTQGNRAPRVPPPRAPEPPPSRARWLGRANLPLQLLKLLLSLEGSTPRHQRYLGPRPDEPELGRIYDEAREALTGDHRHNQEVGEWYRREIETIFDELPESERTEGNVSVKSIEEEPDPCEIGPYREMRRKCNLRGEQAHHIVPDFTLRTGRRPSSNIDDTQRIKGMPTLAEGMSICLKGLTRQQDGEHYAAHFVTDDGIRQAGVLNPALLGTAAWEDVRESSLAGIRATKEQCYPMALEAVAQQFTGIPDNQLLRATMDYRQMDADTLTNLGNGAYLMNGSVISP